MIEFLRKLALSFPETIEAPHFDLTSFRVKKKIFVTYNGKINRACLMLSPVDQDVFCLIDKSLIYPVPNKWGKRGATYFELEGMNEEVLTDAVTTAYCNIAPKALADLVRPVQED